jgi:hypothetical protein
MDNKNHVSVHILTSILEAGFKDPNQLSLITNMSKGEKYETTQQFIEIINNEALITYKQGFEKPEVILEWCKFIVNEHKYDKTKVRTFLNKWLLEKQRHITGTLKWMIGNPNDPCCYIKDTEANQKWAIKQLKYCYELDHLLTNVCQEYQTYSNFNRTLSIVNKNNIERLHGWHIYLDVSDVTNYDYELTLEPYMFEFWKD